MEVWRKIKTQFITHVVLVEPPTKHPGLSQLWLTPSIQLITFLSSIVPIYMEAIQKQMTTTRYSAVENRAYTRHTIWYQESRMLGIKLNFRF